MIAKNKKLKTIFAPQATIMAAFFAGLVLSLGMFVALTPQASAVTRMEECNQKDSPSAIAACKDQLDVATWNACTGNADPGACATAYKNAEAGGSSAAVIANPERDEIANCTGSPEECIAKNPIITITQTAINFLSIGAGIIIVAMIIVGGIQYSASGSNPQGVANAKKRITSALLALLALIFLYAFMQWLVPGGVF